MNRPAFFASTIILHIIGTTRAMWEGEILDGREGS